MHTDSTTAQEKWWEDGKGGYKKWSDKNFFIKTKVRGGNIVQDKRLLHAINKMGAYGKAGNRNETETRNGNWKWNWKQKWNKKRIGAMFSS